MSKDKQEMVRLLLNDAQADQEDFYARHYTPRQRTELKQAMNKTLWDEIGLLRLAIKNFYQAATKGKAPRAVEQVAIDLHTLGLSCTRLARMMHVNQALCADQPETLNDAVNDAIESLLDEMRLKGGPGGLAQGLAG